MVTFERKYTVHLHALALRYWRRYCAERQQEAW